MLFFVLIEQKKAARFRCMTGCMQHTHRQLPDPEFFAVLRIVHRVIRFSARTVYDGCTGCLREVDVTGNKISVEMRFKNAFDLHRSEEHTSELQSLMRI